MTKEDSTDRLYKHAKQNKEFCKCYVENTGEEIPSDNIFTDCLKHNKLKKLLFALFYYGWLLGKGLYVGELKEYLNVK